MAKIAVEESLTSIKQALADNGYEVTSIEQSQDAACLVISGQDQNIMGITAATTPAPVISAHGLTDEEIVQAVNKQTGLQSY
ncbi:MULTISPECIES: YkuS family protein [Paenibacillus]|uniref:YkuS family protein n=1 Tax=Paenibacillus lutrae TaxID=2078573 RepID=A0A7X3JXL1_9BACL|nr:MULTISPECIES: YkuS family protein [Paenibacillus]MVO98010.1 hypothetical protein [Paenibacillus lutrae]